MRRHHLPVRTSYIPASWRHLGHSPTCKKRNLNDLEKKVWALTNCCSLPNLTFQLVVLPVRNRRGQWFGGGQAKPTPSHTQTISADRHSPAHTPDLNFGTPRAYDLLIMNLNPLFWVNELKEIGQRMKATGPINSILWCITLPHHSSRPLRAFCLYPLCYSLIILSGVRVHVANCAERLSLWGWQKDSPDADTVPSHLELHQLLQFFDFFFLTLVPSFPVMHTQSNKQTFGRGLLGQSLGLSTCP